MDGLHFPKTQVLLTSMDGISRERTARDAVGIELDCTVGEKGTSELRLRQTLYAGPPKTIHHPRLEAGWAVCVLDGVLHAGAAEQWLRDVSLLVDTYADGEVPREAEYLRIRRIRLVRRGEVQAALEIDPHEVFGP